RALRRLDAALNRFATKALKRKHDGEKRPRASIPRVDLQCALAHAYDDTPMAKRAHDAVVPRHKIQFVSIRAGGRATFDGFPFFRQQLQLQRLDNGFGYFVLQRKDVAHIAVVAFRPDVLAGCTIYQLGGDPHPPASLANATLQDVADLQL